MSLWLYGRKRGGRRSLWAIDDPVFALMIAVPIVTLVCMSLLSYPWIPFALLLAGLACLIVSRTPLARGYTNLSKIAYVLLGVGMFLMLLLWSKWRMTP
jgi:hypothetical protein